MAKKQDNPSPADLFEELGDQVYYRSQTEKRIQQLLKRLDPVIPPGDSKWACGPGYNRKLLLIERDAFGVNASLVDDDYADPSGLEWPTPGTVEAAEFGPKGPFRSLPDGGEEPDPDDAVVDAVAPPVSLPAADDPGGDAAPALAGDVIDPSFVEIPDDGGLMPLPR